MAGSRDRARELAAGGEGGWFEQLYAEAGGDPDKVPWADLAPNPLLLQWLRDDGDTAAFAGPGQRVLVIACGLGDDAEHLAARGAAVTAFDISPTAIAWAQRRFPGSAVDYQVADLFKLPESWRGAFDAIFEANTLQVLGDEDLPRALASLAAALAPGGRLRILARARDAGQPRGQLPWPLCLEDLAPLRDLGLIPLEHRELLDDEDPPVRRLRCEFHRPR